LKKGLPVPRQALDYSGGAERDRTVGLLNAIRVCNCEPPEILNKIEYPDDATGD